MILDKFIIPYIEFINKNFNPNDHLFVIFGEPKKSKFINQNFDNVLWITFKKNLFNLLLHLYKSEKIIIHGLWLDRLIQLIYFQPWLIKKCYWVMWGGDFYFPEKQTSIKKKFIKKIKHVITYIDGDVDYIKNNYGANPINHNCIMYLSSIFDENNYKSIKKINKNELWILIGNSATETNNHEFIFSKLEKFKNENIKLIVPLSYGNELYKKKIIEIGYKIFGNKFSPLINFLPYESYLKVLYNIDIGIFAHTRQQGMGTTIQLLGLGKKVYLNINTSQWQFFKNLGIKIFDINKELNLHINYKEFEHNKLIIKNFFSLKNLKSQWSNIFYT